jgi:hypothetical protein
MRDYVAHGPPQDILSLFEPTMAFARAELPRGILRGQSTVTPINLYEAIVVGIALVLKQGTSPRHGVLPGLLDNQELRRFSTAGSNNRPMVIGRIELVRNALL